MNTTTTVIPWSTDERWLTGDQMRAAAATLDEVRSAHGIGLALVSGSLAVGLGHAISDIDLYVIPADGLPLRSRTYTDQGHPVQVNPLTAEELAGLVPFAEEFRVTSADRAQLSLGPARSKLMLRLVNGRLLEARPDLAELLGRLDRDVVRRLMILRHACFAVELAEDVQGTLASGDFYTALTASHRALLHALESGLAGAGDIYDHEKVLFRRLVRHPALGHLTGEAWNLLNCGIRPGDPAEAAHALARRRLLLVSHLIAAAVLDGWSRPLRLAPPFAPDVRGPLRSPFFGLLRFADGIALTGQDKGYRVSEPAARLWAALDGRPLAEAIDGAVPPGGDAPGPQATQPDRSAAEQAVRRFAGLGAVEY
jgi:hypothetical protein